MHTQFQVGHVQTVDLGNGKKVSLITRSLMPLAFEIPDFLSEFEIQFMISKAKQQNMAESEAKSGLSKQAEYVKSAEKGKAQGQLAHFDFWDTDNDGYIDIYEAMDAAKRHHSFLRPNENDIRDMFDSIDPALFEDELISKEEWMNMHTIRIEDRFNYWFAEDKRFKSRYSEQTWLMWEDDKTGTLQDIRDRVVKLTKLPKKVIYGGEPIQMAHYYPNGHYHAHYDSETHLRSDLPCCHQQGNGLTDGTGKCIICRFITIMTYMNDVEEGGETAFIIADNATYNQQVSIDQMNLSKHCKDANLVVRPKKGTALFWYNHYVDSESKFLGELDPFSLHGGCDVIKGEKWISNIWLPTSFESHKEKQSVYYKGK